MLTPWEKIKVARMPSRPTALYYIQSVFDSFIELHGDRNFRDDSAIIGGIGMLNGQPVTIIAQEKGTTIAEKSFRNFGSTHPEGFRKALRLMKQAEKFRRPIVTFADTQGAFCGVSAEERGQGEAIARNLREMMDITVPIITFFIGEGGSGGALAISVSNEIYILEHAGYSILSPEGFASILWRDASRAEEAASVMKMTAADLLELKIVDGIIAEPEGGAHQSKEAVAAEIKSLLEERLDALMKFTPEQIAEQRYNRFRAF